MKYKNFLDDILGQKSKLKALRYIVNYKSEISIRELSRAIKLTAPNVSIILKELDDAGVLTSRKFGTSIVFALNKGHFLVDDIIIPLFMKEKEAKAELGKAIVKNITFSFESMILFGSIAGNTAHSKSDIDLAVIINDKDSTDEVEDKILDINPLVTMKFGNSLSPYVIKKSEFLKRKRKHDKLITSIIKDGMVIAGKSISELIISK